MNIKLLKENQKLNKEFEIYGLNLTDNQQHLSLSMTLEPEKTDDYESESIEIKKLETIS